MDAARRDVIDRLSRSSIFLSGNITLQSGSGATALLDETGTVAVLVSTHPLPHNIAQLLAPPQLPPLPT
eukprot:4995132-Prorocentrum_lima.AAC.1